MYATYAAFMGLDVLMIVLTIAFFAFAAALVVWLDWI